MAYRVKKFRGYRRMLKKLMRVVEDYQPNWRPDEADGREEFLELDLYSHRFFHPRGKDRKALFSALLRKTEALIAAKPAELPFCKIAGGAALLQDLPFCARGRPGSGGDRPHL